MVCRNLIIAVTIFFFLIGNYIQLYAQEEGASAPPTIEKIEVKGNNRISASVIRSAIKIREGDVYDSQAISQDVDGIWLLGFFDNIEVEVESYEDGIKIIFLVAERPVIRDIVFVGNSLVKTKKLKEVVGLKKGDYLKHYLQKLGEDRIQEVYQQKGFHFVEVKSSEKRVKGYVDIIYDIDEGLKVYVKDVNFVGNKAFTDKRLSKVIKTKKRKFPSFLFQGKFDRGKFNEDIEQIKSFYIGGGWLDADVKWKAQYSKDKTRLYLNVFIDEGERYFVDAITIKGNTLFTDAEIRNMIGSKEGAAFLLGTLSEDSQNIRKAYGIQGYVDANVKASHAYKQIEPKVELTFNVNENERVFIDKVKIFGNDKTKDNVIRRELLFYPGERLNTDKIRNSQQRLTGTGFFDNESGMPTSMTFEPGSKPNTRNVLVNVKEGRTGLLRFGGGFGANVGAFADVSYTDKNFDIFDFPKDWKDFISGNAFRGAGHVLTVRFSPGFQRTEGLFSFHNPSVYDTGYSFGLSGFGFRRGREDYTEERSGGKITVGKEIFRGLVLRVTPDYEIIGIQDVDDDAPAIVEGLEGKNSKLSLVLNTIYDRRNSRFSPTKGYKIDSTFEISGLDVDIIKFVIGAKRYHTIFDFVGWGKHVLSYGGTIGVVGSTTKEDVPIFERLFAGGSNSIRGFSFRGVGPIDPFREETDKETGKTVTRGGEQIGGKVLLLGSLEYTMPLYGDTVRSAFFIDAGKADTDTNDINFNNLRASLGFGFRVRVPFLGNSVISVDFGFPFVKKSTDDEQTMTFNFGGSGL